MASVVEICNLALSHIGDVFIESLTENTKEARRCRLGYDPARRALLRGFNWNFARARAELAALTAAPAFGYDAAFQTPVDCLRVLQVVDDPEWSVEGRQILATGDTLQIVYTADVEDPTRFDPLFVRALSLQLASDIAYSLAPKAELVKNLVSLFEMAMVVARRVGAVESDWKTRTAAIDSNDWTTARA